MSTAISAALSAAWAFSVAWLFGADPSPGHPSGVQPHWGIVLIGVAVVDWALIRFNILPPKSPIARAARVLLVVLRFVPGVSQALDWVAKQPVPGDPVEGSPPTPPMPPTPPAAPAP